ncbi:PREDICTED: small VCP/p97-interacting protein-like [Branchiostoma belcheri]|uniref:Small VCP/p97-interacting protein-like n=1 Tax=Branchiostoma belcheri TaxID=7741 RepID=A0A6P4YZV4_BRABE|nr:PREDICTED: small VCP/p97-interacting protein-like [Branchiostoma belcheri]
MGGCLPCLQGQADDYIETPNPEERRQQMLEAAEKRQQANESRGLKDPEGVKRAQKRKAEAEQKADIAGPGEGGLKWQMG